MLELVYNHIALPSQLPGKEDVRIDEISNDLIIRLLDASRHLKDVTNSNLCDSWDSIRRSLQTCRILNLGSTLNSKSLVSEFRALEGNEIIILHVSEQNAGLLIRRDHE
jgi:hypothetical protein